MQKCENSKEMLDCDAVLASLFIAVEDDAFKSRTSVCLPQEAYVKRLRKLMDEFEMRDIAYFNGQYDDRMVLKALERYLYEEHQYRPPVGWMEAFSPVQNVFSQRHCAKSRHPGEFSGVVYGCVQILRARDFERRSVRFDIQLERFRSGCSTAHAVGYHQGRLPQSRHTRRREVVYA